MVLGNFQALLQIHIGTIVLFFFFSRSLKYREREGEGDEISDCLQSNGKK